MTRIMRRKKERRNEKDCRLSERISGRDAMGGYSAVGNVCKTKQSPDRARQSKVIVIAFVGIFTTL